MTFDLQQPLVWKGVCISEKKEAVSYCDWKPTKGEAFSKQRILTESLQDLCKECIS